MQFWSIADFAKMAIPKIVNITEENKWIVLWLKNGQRIKFKRW